MADTPYDDRDGYIWFDGKLVDWRDAKIHILTHAMHYASSVFEGARCYQGVPFKMKEHNERLLNSAKLLNMPVTLTEKEINDAVNATIEANGFADKDCYIRPILWRGAEQMGVSTTSKIVHFAVAVWAWPSYFSMEKRLKGIRTEFSNWKRPSPETIPCAAKASGLYMICTMSKDKAEANGYDDSIMLDYRGYVAEATGANIFFLKDGALHTPKPDCILDGITRRTVIDLARARGVEVIERVIMPEELDDFEEAFLTGTAAEVTPLAEIGPHRYQVGKVTEMLVKAYDDLVHCRIDG